MAHVVEDGMSTNLMSEAEIIERAKYLEKKQRFEATVAGISDAARVTSDRHKRLLVLFDGTESMDRYRKGTRKVVQRLLRLLKSNMGADIKMDVVGVVMRDPLESSIESPKYANTATPGALTATRFVEFLGHQECTGGGDIAEDWAGALSLLVETTAGAPPDADAETDVILTIVTDAPPHGCAGDLSDHHNTDEQRERLDSALRDLVALINNTPGYASFQCQLIVVNNFEPMNVVTEQLRHCFRADALPAGSPAVAFQRHDLQDECFFDESLLRSTYNSVVFHKGADGGTFCDAIGHDGRRILAEAPVLAQFEGYGVSFSDSADTGEIDRTREIALLNMRICRPSLPANCVGFMRKQLAEYASSEAFEAHRANWVSFMSAARPKQLSMATKHTTCMLRVEKKPFGQGSERWALQASLTEFTDDESAGIYAGMHRDELNHRMQTDAAKRARGEEGAAAADVVIKIPKWNMGQHPASKLECAVAAAVVGQAFNAKFPGWPIISVILPSVAFYERRFAKVMRSGATFFVTTGKAQGADWEVLVEPLIAADGPFRKFINNDGTQSAALLPDADDDDTVEKYRDHLFVLHLFVLFAIHETKGRYVPSDLQGKYVPRTRTFVLTDLSASSRNIMAFDPSTNAHLHGIQTSGHFALKQLLEFHPSALAKMCAALKCGAPEVAFAPFLRRVNARAEAAEVAATAAY